MGLHGLLLIAVISFYMCVTVNSTMYTTKKAIHKDGQSPTFSPEEMYRDMFVLTRENFTDTVLRHKDPWIVLFHAGSLDKAWKTMATSMRGLCWIGIVDVRHNKQLLDELMYIRSEDIARVYPYGSRNTKERKWTRVTTQNEAVQKAMSQLPDKTQRIRGSEVKDLYTDSFLSIPSRFPVYLITENEATSDLFKAISVRFEKYFNFGKIVKPSEADKKELGIIINDIQPPSIYVMVTANGAMETISAIQFDESKFGAMNYTNIIQFLFTINSQFRHSLPGQNLASSQQEAEMADILKIEEKRFDIMFPQPKGNVSKKPAADPVKLTPTITRHVGKDEL